MDGFEANPPQPPRPIGRRGRDQGLHPNPAVVPRFDVTGLVRRARRNARLSQREMATAIGVGQSTIARAERDGARVSVPVLLAILAVGGIQLQAVEGTDEVEIMRPDALRDRGHRKLPAHLEAHIRSQSERVPTHWRGSERRGAPVGWSLRSRIAEVVHLRAQHPGPEDLRAAQRVEEERLAFEQDRREALRRPIPPRPPLPECYCSDECIELGMACPRSCPCQCESAHRVAP